MKHSTSQKVFSEVTAGWEEFKSIRDSIRLFYLSNILNSETAAFTEFPVTNPIDPLTLSLLQFLVLTFFTGKYVSIHLGQVAVFYQSALKSPDDDGRMAAESLLLGSGSSS